MGQDQELAAALHRLEARRQGVRRKVKVGASAIVGAGALLCVLGGVTIGAPVAFVAGAAGLVVALFYANGQLEKFKRAFKGEVIPVLLALIDPSLRYAAVDSISRDEFNAPGMFTSPDRFSGKDLVVGHIGETALRFSLVHAEEEHEERTTDSDGHTRTETRYTTIFSGLFLIADFNKEFSGRTLVSPGATGFLGKLSKSHVALEDPVFNQMFSVSSTDQVQARYVLTPALMERFKALRSRVGAFHAGFCNGRLFLAIDMPSDAFEPSTGLSLVESAQVAGILRNLRSATDIVDELDLNTRIWTKGTGRAAVASAAQRQAPESLLAGLGLPASAAPSASFRLGRRLGSAFARRPFPVGVSILAAIVIAVLGFGLIDSAPAPTPGREARPPVARSEPVGVPAGVPAVTLDGGNNQAGAPEASPQQASSPVEQAVAAGTSTRPQANASPDEYKQQASERKSGGASPPTDTAAGEELGVEQLRTIKNRF